MDSTFVFGGILLLALLVAPFIYRLWRKSSEEGELDRAGMDLNPISGKGLQDLVSRGLMTEEEAVRVREKTREQISRSLAAQAAKELSGKNPKAGTADERVALAAAEAKRARAELAPADSPSETAKAPQRDLPKPPPPAAPKRKPLPEHLKPMIGRPASELADLAQAGFLSDDDMALLKDYADQ